MHSCDVKYLIKDSQDNTKENIYIYLPKTGLEDNQKITINSKNGIVGSLTGDQHTASNYKGRTVFMLPPGEYTTIVESEKGELLLTEQNLGYHFWYY